MQHTGRSWFRFGWMALFAVAVALGGCALEVQPESASTADPVTFTATEYAYDGPESIPSGITEVALQNDGQEGHGLWLVRLDEGKGFEDVMDVLMSEDPNAPIPDWVQFYGGTAAGPGERNSYWIDLPAGQYVMFSFQPDDEGVPGFAKGLVKELAVTQADGAAATAALPQSDATVEFVDFSFIVSPEFASGEQLVEVSNTGMEPHEMVMLKLGPGVTMEDMMEMMMAEMAGEAPPAEMQEGPPPVQEAGMIAPISAGVKAVYPMNLEPGEYVLLCFIPSGANDGAAHLELGMLQQLTVQ